MNNDTLNRLADLKEFALKGATECQITRIMLDQHAEHIKEILESAQAPAKPKVYEALAGWFSAYKNNIAREALSPTTEDRQNAQHWLNHFNNLIIETVENKFPSGSGFNSGTQMSFHESSPERLVFTTAFHHMSEAGFYEGWTQHTVIVTPSLQHGFIVRVTGRDKNQIKEYITELFSLALSSEI